MSERFDSSSSDGRRGDETYTREISSTDDDSVVQEGSQESFSGREGDGTYGRNPRIDYSRDRRFFSSPVHGADWTIWDSGKGFYMMYCSIN